MIALIQRVTEASVTIDGTTVAAIDQGIMALIGVQQGDTQQQSKRLAERLLGYRIFSDKDDKMNLNVCQIEGSVLLVPQFTLAADTSSGMRPSFSSAAPPEKGVELFNHFVEQCQQRYQAIRTGEFGADMDVRHCNQGPVTFWLQVEPD